MGIARFTRAGSKSTTWFGWIILHPLPEGDRDVSLNTCLSLRESGQSMTLGACPSNTACEMLRVLLGEDQISGAVDEPDLPPLRTRSALAVTYSALGVAAR